MTDFAEARKRLPNLAALDNDQFINAVHQLYYPDLDKGAVAAQLGYKPAAAEQPQAGLLRTAGDVGVKVAQGVVDLGAAAVGLGSLATGGLVGKGMRAIGYDPQGTNAALGEYLSESQKAADAKVAQAEGFGETVKAALENPRSIIGSVAQSAPGMVAGMGVTGAIARGIGTRAALATAEGAAASAAELAAGRGAAAAGQAAMKTKAGAEAASKAIDAAGSRLMAYGAATEGAQTAGNIADQAQAAGRDYSDYAPAALAAGAGTAAIGIGAGKLMGDAATEIATGAHGAGVKGHFATRAAKSALSEGVLEEMPQSAQEQVFTNLAMGDDPGKGVGNAAGAGLVTGGAMGAGMGAAQRSHAAPAPVVLPNTGPLSQAANAGQAAAAAQAAVQATAAPAEQQQAAAPGPSLADIEARLAELVAIGHGKPEQRLRSEEGVQLVPAVQGRPLTQEERAEYAQLEQARRDRKAIPPEQRAEFQALLDEEQAAIDAKFQPALQAAAQERDEQETQQIQAMVDADVRQAREQEAAQQTAALADVDARVQRRDAERAAATRRALRDDIINDPAIANKAEAFQAALQRQGYRDTQLTDEDRADFQEAATPLPSVPNELVDAVPERAISPSAPVATNTDAVDAAIAAGMRLKTPTGKVLHKRGSGKVFTLSTAQKAYYEQRMAQLAVAETPAMPVPIAVQAEEHAVARENMPENAQNALESGKKSPENAPDVLTAATTAQPETPEALTVDTPAAAQQDDLYQQAKHFVQGSGHASILQLQRHLRIGYNRAGRLMERMEADKLVSPMTSDGQRTVLVPVSAIDAGAHQAATSPMNDLDEPTQAQKEAGNYKMGHVRLHGLDLSIENAAGSTRSGVDRDGTPWENTMQHHYGYIKGTTGADKDHIDAFIGPNHDSQQVFVVDQVHPDNRKFDEHKVMLGFDSLEQARDAYLANYADGWQGGDRISETDVDGFKAWLKNGNTGKKFANDGTVRKAQVADVRPQLAEPAVVPAADVAPQAAAEPAAAIDAPAGDRAAPSATERRRYLNGRFIKDMSDAELLDAQQLLADGPRAAKIDKEIAARGLTPVAAPAAAPVDAGMLPNATAPEHIVQGVDDRELGQIVEEFNQAQSDMMGGEHAVSNIFQPPKKADVVRLADKAKVYHKEHGWMTPAEAKAKIAEWKAHAQAQGNDADSRSANAQRVVLSLFDLSGEWSRPWEEAGYQVFRFDIQDDPVVGDVNNFSSHFFSDWFGDFDGVDVYAILAATPCTDFAVSGARHFAAKDADGRTVASVKLVHQTLRVIEYFKPAVWGLENPVGRIERLGGLPPWRLSFDPNHLGDPYTKKTLIWGRFNGDLPVAPVEPTEGSKMHKLYGGKSMATKNARSVTPEGFSYGFFMANNAIDHPVMAISHKYDRLDRDLIAQAVAAGITESQISSAVEDYYYMDLDDAAANDAIRDLIADAQDAAAPEQETPPTDAPARRALPADVKTYSADEAQAEWDRAPAGKRNMWLARVDLRDASFVAQPWADLAPIEREQVHTALNEDFYTSAWYINTAGERITLGPELNLPKPSPAQLADEAAAQGWEALDFKQRYSLLLRHGIGHDAQQGQFSTWQNLAPDLRRSMTPELTAPAAVSAEPAAAPAAKAKRKTKAAPVATAGNLTDTDTQPTGQQNDSTTSSGTAALDPALDAGTRPARGGAATRGAQRARRSARPADAGAIREPGGRAEGPDDGGRHLGHGAGDDAVHDGSPDPLAGRGERHAADFRPGPGGLTRTGSWFETASRNIDLIDLARRIEAEGRPAAPEEQEQLARYVGFGAGEMRNRLFPVPPDYAKRQDPQRLIWPQFVSEPRWKALAERLDTLPRDWQKSVLQSTQYAHYTSENIIRSMWDAVQRLGFTGGKVFEPGMGIGSFAMLMPDGVRATSRYTGIEFDGPTALIARLLSPEQHALHDDFIKRQVPRDFFDMAIGNPPFSATKVYADPDYEKHGFMLHDFFFAKAIDRVRPGGLLAFVTSKGTMDKQNDKARRYLAERADLLGAIRLPSTAFEGNAGTSVVTDVIFLRKRLPGEAPGGMPWEGVETVDTKDGPVVVNQYYAQHPGMVLGQQRISGNTDDMGRRINSNGRGGEQYTVVSYDATPAELDAKFAQAVESLPENVYKVLGQDAASVQRETAKVDFDPAIKREGVIYVGEDGAMLRVEEGVGRPLGESVKLSEADSAWFRDYVGLRDLVQSARQAQASGDKWQPALNKLNKAYDAFRAKHGPINDYRVQVRKSTDEEGNPVETSTRIYKNRRRYREDYDAAVLTQLETINEAGEIVKAPFLLGRTIGVPVTRDIKTVADALAVSLDARGTLDLPDVARRIKLSEADAIEALGDQVFKTPAGQWQLADEYLSGDVVAKLEEAEQAARLDPALRRNVEALTAAQPERLGPSQISVKLGASWVRDAYVNEFAREIGAGAVTFDPITETWQVEGGNLRSGRNAAAEYGTAARSPSELLEAVLNSRPIKVTTTTEDKKTVTDTVATTAANEMAKKIRDKFKGWVWTDTERAADLVDVYNKRFNNIAPRRFDGSHLTLPGVSMRYTLHGHQKRAIWRQIQTGDTYLAHSVGSGKTIEMIAGGMEQKRLGLIDKPMYVVPNHMLEQFANEFLELYPLANIMVADDDNFNVERRQAFIASATLNKPDAIIITHDAFQRIGVHEASVSGIRDDLLANLHIELSETASGSDGRVRRSQLEQQIEAVGQRFDRIIAAGGKDATIKFEDMGVDFVYVDEAHAYRKLDFHTAQQIKGIDPNGSKRALDMYVKTRYLQKRRPGRAMVFASGTPITNTMGELYTIMRFFAPQALEKAGIATFDAWSRQFGEVLPALEPNAAGKYEVVERFAKFDNVPELMSRVRQFMDVLTSEQLRTLVKRPDLIGGKPQLVVVEPTEQLQDYMQGELARRIEISKRWKPTKQEPNNPDPVVAIITDGRFAAIDPRFFGAGLAQDEASIITSMADGVVQDYHANRDNVYLDKAGQPEPIKGGTQIVFYNLGFGAQSQAARGFNARAAFMKRLVDGGIPRDEIAWFEDANTDAKKEAIFKAMRAGQLRVLIGSAKKMGTGVNVQKRLVALHYQDPPWFPSDVEQPHGRIDRQGNQNPWVSIKWYTTRGTYQSTMWQMVARKQRFIDQAFMGDKSMRSMEDLGEASLFEQAAAVASGDPRAIQLAGLKQDVERLERLQAAHANEQIRVRNTLQGEEWEAKTARAAIATYTPAFKALGERHVSFFTGTVADRSYDKPGEFGEAIKSAFNRIARDVQSAEDVELGRMGEVIRIGMDAELDKKNAPTGEYTVAVQVGAVSRDIIRTDLMGADVDAVGLARRVVNAVNHIGTELAQSRQRLVDAERNIAGLQRKRGAPFEQQQELLEKYAELTQLEEELRQEGAAASAAAQQALDQEAQATADEAAAPAMPAAPAAEYFRADDTLSLPAIDAGDDAGSAAPAQLDGAAYLQAMKSTEQLNRYITRKGMAPVKALRAAPTNQFALARQIGQALGIEVNYVTSNGEFEGVAYRGVAYLAEGMRSAELAIAGHETLHALQQSNPALGEQLRTQIRAYLKEGVVAHRQMRESLAAGLQEVTTAQAESEVMADINGAMWIDPQFWSQLAKADRSLLRAVAYKFMEVAAKLVQHLRGARFDVARLVSDVDAVRAIMVATWARQTAHKDSSEAISVREPGGDAYNDPYENTPTRPGTTDRQRDTGRRAVQALRRRFGLDRVGNGRDADRGQGTVLGSRLVADFVAGQPNQLVGQVIRTPADLAAVAQVYRDPRFETVRVVFTQGEQIVGETGYTSRLPGAVGLPATITDYIAADRARFGADGYYLMHNHPTGRATPSNADAHMTRTIAAAVEGFHGHVVIDHNEYAVIGADGAHQVIAAPELNGRDFTAMPALEHRMLGERITGPLYVAQLAKALQIPAGHAVLVLAGLDGKINLLADVPMGALRDQSPAGLAKGKALLRRMARESGSGGRRFIVLPEGAAVDDFAGWVGAGAVTDVVSADVQTAQANGAVYPGDFLERQQPVYTLREPADDAVDVPQFSRTGLSEALAAAGNRAQSLQLPAGYRLADLFNRSGQISWWHKTIGTMDNLAKRHPAFARVYNAVQRFLGDVSRYAVVAADVAPTLLPKLENIRDILGKDRKKAVTAEDTKAIGAPIFQGTLNWARDAHGKPVRIEVLEEEAQRLSAQDKARILLSKGVMDDDQHRVWQAMPIGMYESTINRRFADSQLKAGVVWSDAELRDLFSLNDAQIGLYREFRGAIDKSLTNLTISEMIKMGGKDSILMEQAIEAPDLRAAAALLRDHYVALAKLHPEQADMHLDTAHQIMGLADKGQDLMDRGYAPLMRFGKHTVYVQEGEEQVYFGMFESKAEAAKMAREMAADYPDATVTQGTVSEEAYKLFAGVSPETIELFGSMLGMEEKTSGSGAELYQAYLKMAKANRSAMKRMIHRKGVAGFSEDAGRVLAGFIYSNARLTSGNVHLGEIDEAVTDIPKQQGELTDAAMELRDHIRNPEGGGHVLGGLMFAQFLGGSIASAMVNLTQPFTMTLPYLSQWGGIARAGQRLASAVRDAGRDSTGDAQLDAALKWAEDEGIVAPQEVHYLQAQAAGKGALRAGDGSLAGNARAHASNALAKVSLGWGKLFAMAELANRRITFIAAYRTAISLGHHDPALFAQEAVSQTQGTYNSGNKPRWARNTIGSLLMTFKQYSIGYLELLTRMATAGAPGSPQRRAGQRAALYMLAVLMLMGGADGLPFEQDIEDAIDGILQRLGYNFSTKRAKQDFLTGVLGAGGADFALKGVSSLPGMPVDVAGRFGMGNLIPGTGLLTKKESYTRDLGELAGPAGDLAARAFSGAGKLLGGDVAGAALDLSPAAVRNVAKGVDMLDAGAYRDARGYRVNDTSTAEAVLKAAGFQPNSTANVQDAKGQALNAIAQTRMRGDEIAEHWARGLAEGNQAMVDEARAWRDDWNAKNPEAPVRVSLPGVIRRVKAMKQDAVMRTQKTAPAALKVTVQRELADLRS